MSHQHPANRDRVSPRRRFHRPAAEFLGARRQVPVLTGLPRIGDEVKQPEVETPIPEPDVVEQALESATAEPTVNIREAGTHLQGSSDPWREWAYPIGGILVASLLCYTAWAALHYPNAQSPSVQVVEEVPAREFVPVQVAEAPPVDSVSLAPAPPAALETNQQAFTEPVVQAPAMQNMYNEQFLQQPFQEPPTPPKPRKSNDFVQHEVLEWNDAQTSVASKPEEPQMSSPSFANAPLQSEANTEDETGDIHDALPLLSNESPEDLGSDLDDYPSTGFDEDFLSPQANFGAGGGIDLAEITPPQTSSAAEMANESLPLLPATPSPNAAMSPIATQQPGTVTLPLTNSQHSAHVVVNPHFHPTQVPATNSIGAGAAFETARATPMQTNGMAQAPQQPSAPQYAQSSYSAQPSPAPASNKSIYGSFPVTGAANQSSSIPTSVEQARLNGSIEPFPRSN